MLALTFQLFAALCGWLEAILYARRGAESFQGNEHGGMMWQRISVVLVAGVAVLEYQWLGAWLALELVPLALLFPLCHDEAYNFTRLWLNWTEYYQKTDLLNTSAGRPCLGDTDRLAWHSARQQYRYGYQSPTTTARNDFRGSSRTWLAVIGGVLLLAGYTCFFWLR